MGAKPFFAQRLMVPVSLRHGSNVLLRPRSACPVNKRASIFRFMAALSAPGVLRTPREQEHSGCDGT